MPVLGHAGRLPWRRRFEGQFTVIFLPIALAVAVLFVGVFEFVADSRGKAFLRDKMASIAANQSILIARRVYAGDLDTARLVLASAIRDPHVGRIAVLSADGVPLIDMHRGDENTHPDLVTAVPLRYGTVSAGDKVGTLIVEMSKEQLERGRKARLMLSAGLAMAFGIVILVAAAIVNRRLIQTPLSRLTGAIERTSQGAGAERVDWPRDDEFGILVHAFNRMRDRQDRFETQLELARNELEARVRERTWELAQARDDAEDASRAKSMFLANMSHELRTPLNSIIGFAEIMSKHHEIKLDEETRTGYASNIFESGQHLLGVINDLLDISKAEAGKLEIIEEEMALDHSVRATMGMVESSAERTGVSLIKPEETGIEILADERKIRQILLNLLSNAVKFTMAGGNVRVSVALTEEGGVQISVSDTGIGIPEGEIEHVLEPFAQIENSFVRRSGGTGLGLPLVRILADLHQGDINIESEEGVGTTVVLTLPRERVVNPS